MRMPGSLAAGSAGCYMGLPSGGSSRVLQKLYDRTIALSAHRHALLALALISFIESSVFPIPPDVLLIPMVLAARDRAWIIAGVATAASVLGGFAGYAIGSVFFEGLGRPILDFYGYTEKFREFAALYNEWGIWIVGGAGFTPFPYKVITIASGVTGLDLTEFGIASLVSRGARFFLVAALLWQFGPPLRRFIEGNLALLTTAFFVLLVGGFVVLRLVL
jgi:membrane protein YqaA with SNARE-associated domain